MLGREGLEYQLCHCSFDMKVEAGDHVVHKNQITRRGRDGSFFESWRLYFGDVGISHSVECVFTLNFFSVADSARS